MFAATQQSTLIRGGLIVNATGQRTADILIQGEKIAAIDAKLSRFDSRTTVIDAAGLQIMPGGIDPHVHLSPPFADDFASGSRAAFAGGITTVGAMAFVDEGEPVDKMLARYARNVALSSGVDVVLHGGMNAPPDLAALDCVAAAGQTTFKIFTMDGDFDRDYLCYAGLLRQARKLGLLPMFHCEDRQVLDAMLHELQAAGQTSIEHYEASRPVLAEVLAVQKVIALCELTQCPVYIVHLSSARGLQICVDAQRRGVPVYVETRPIYLHLTADKYRGADGPLYVGMPPLRSSADGKALWRGLADGSIHTIGSDHAPWSRREKLDPRHDIADPLAGMSNLQTMLPMLYSEGVLQGRLSPERFVQVTSTNAAKLFGLYPRKGVIEAGADADLNLWDSNATFTLSAAQAYSREDFSIYEGWEVKGGITKTFHRGELVCEAGKVHERASRGRLLERSAELRTTL